MVRNGSLNDGVVPPPGIPAEEYVDPATGKTKADIQPKGNIVVLEQDSFHSFLAQADRPVLVDFWALWCAPCTRMIPVFEAIADERDDIYVAKVNVDKCKALAAQYSIMTIPTMVLFKDGEPVASASGAMNKGSVLRGIEEFL